MRNKNLKIAIIVPTLNAGLLWRDWICEVKKQTGDIKTVLVIDSGSDDDTRLLATQNNFEVHQINKLDFNHGATRQYALNFLDSIDIAVFLTQDAILAHPEAISELVNTFTDDSVGAAYGRQLPRKNANPIEAHGRLFNYPDKSCLKSISDLTIHGFNIVFMSNSFAAYRISALTEAGGFPSDVILGEDTYICAKLLKRGWKIAYQTNAEVFHSHGYSLFEEARRYFDLGVFHARENWLVNEFGGPSTQGQKFVKSELSYLYDHSLSYIPLALIRTVTKYISYKLGRLEGYLPLRLKIKLSMNKQFWMK